MAIIAELGLEVKILIGGKAVKEYPDPEPDLQGLKLGPKTKTSHCYIECQENMEFQIQSKVRSGNKPAALWAKKKRQTVIFSTSFNGGPYLREAFVDEPGHKDIDDGIIDFDHGTIQKFRFSTVSTVENAHERSVAKDTETAQCLGLLRIGVWRVREELEEGSGEESSGEEQDTSGLSEGSLTLAELALKGKAISLGVSLSSPAKLDLSQYSSSPSLSYFDLKDRPFAVFGFKYRTREDLQKAMIIPRPRIPSPEPAVAEDRQQDAIMSQPRADSNELVADRVRDLSYEEALRLARERLEHLPLEEVFKLFGQEFKEIPLGNVTRLAGERLTKLSLKSVLRLASERLGDTGDQEKTSVNIKSEGQEGQHSKQSSGPPTRIKRERVQEEWRSKRASKHRKTGDRGNAIDLTEGD